MAHHGRLGGVAPLHSQERGPGRLETSRGASTPALGHPQHGEFRAFNQVPIKHGHFQIKLGRFQPGVAIDAHDAVWRINAAPVRGYEAYVGSKETVRPPVCLYVWPYGRKIA